MVMTHIKSPLNKYTFSKKPMREWVESRCIGLTLNLFAGSTILNIQEVRNDIDQNMPADFHMDARELVEYLLWANAYHDTILLDPPYSFRKSMEMYNGHKASGFRQLKDALPEILKHNGRVITFGYHSVSMGKSRGFEVEEIAVFSHGGAIHDTIASVERMV